jgi:integrase
MASISRDPNGTRRIQFFAGDGSRKTIRLPGATAKQAEAFRTNLEALICAVKYGTTDDRIVAWLKELDDDMRQKLSAMGLTKSQNRKNYTLGEFMERYFAQLNIKPQTKIVYGQSERCLVKFFGKEKLLRDIEKEDADKFESWLNTDGGGAKKLASATISRRLGMAKVFFRKALRWECVAKNPFEDTKPGDQHNPDRSALITRAMADKVMEQCPDAQWKLLFALSRYGGLRCPSEHLLLKWSDVNWEHNLITVHSPKTERHKGLESRTVPLFPELRAPLTEVFEEAEPGSEWVITHYRLPNANLRTCLKRIIKLAGLQPWPRLFHNLRATRQTELTDQFPAHVVNKWIGNTEKVANKHYLQTTDEHLIRATQNVTQSTADTTGPQRTPDKSDASKISECPAKSELVHSGPADGTIVTGFAFACGPFARHFGGVSISELRNSDPPLPRFVINHLTLT